MNANLSVKTATRGCLAISTAMLLSWMCGAAPATADEQLRTETVSFRDLNVNSPDGAQALFNRIHAAARRVCSESDPILQIAANACTRKSEADAVKKANLPQLTAYYNSKHGDHPQALIAAR
jgi:UrcA family protein